MSADMADRVRILAADRHRTVALVRAFLAPPGAELTAEAEQLLADIQSGARLTAQPEAEPEPDDGGLFPATPKPQTGGQHL